MITARQASDGKFAMTDRRSNAAPVPVATLLVLLPCLYVGSYLILVKRTHSLTLNSFKQPEFAETYRAGDNAAYWFYKPANLVDRSLRTSYWDYRNVAH
jgi:hypothetical protein